MLRGYKRLLALSALMSGASPVEDTATGNPVTFATDLARPLVSLEIPFTPKQEGTGDPSPENIRNIVPWNGLTFFSGGKNLLPNTASSKTVNGVTFTVNSDGTVSVSGTATGYADLTIGKSEVPNKGKIVLSGLEETVKVRWSQIRILDADNNLLADFYGQSTTRPYVLNMDDYPTAKYLQIGIKREDNNVALSGTVKPMLEVGETATAYEPYAPITSTDIVFPSPMYGGTLDVVSGALKVTKAYALLNDVNKWTQLTEGQTVDFSYEQDFERKLYDGSLTGLLCSAFLAVVNQNVAYCRWRGATNLKFGIKNGNSMATPLTLEDVKQMATDGEIAICYDIEPQTIQLTPEQITALVGNNTIWSDADGQLTAVYLKKA